MFKVLVAEVLAVVVALVLGDVLVTEVVVAADDVLAAETSVAVPTAVCLRNVHRLLFLSNSISK